MGEDLPGSRCDWVQVIARELWPRWRWRFSQHQKAAAGTEFGMRVAEQGMKAKDHPLAKSGWGWPGSASCLPSKPSTAAGGTSDVIFLTVRSWTLL